MEFPWSVNSLGNADQGLRLLVEFRPSTTGVAIKNVVIRGCSFFRYRVVRMRNYRNFRGAVK